MSKTKTKMPAVTQEERRTLKPHEIVLSSGCQNAVGILSWGKFAGESDLPALIEDLREQTKKIQDGSLSSVEAMLYGQAKTLETMFTSLARRAANNDGLKQFQVNLTLALKAQAQCRATLEALAEIKNPRPVSFVKQANIAHGPQQVNNGDIPRSTHAGTHAHAEENPFQQNKLLEDGSNGGTHLDTGTTTAASRSDPALETVEAVHRAKNRRG